MIQDAKAEQNTSTGNPEGNGKPLQDMKKHQRAKQLRSATSRSRNKSESTWQNTIQSEIQGIHVKVMYTKDFGRNPSTQNTEVMKDENILEKHAVQASNSPEKANEETIQHHCSTNTNDFTLHQTSDHEVALDANLEKNFSTAEDSSLKEHIEEDRHTPSKNISLDMYINERSIIMKSKISYLSYSKKLTNRGSTNDTQANQTTMTRKEKSAEHVSKKEDDISEGNTSTKIKRRVIRDERTTNQYKSAAVYHPSNNMNSERVVKNSTPCRTHVTSITSSDEIYVKHNLSHEDKVNYAPNTFPQSSQVLHKDITDYELKQYLEDELQESITKDIVSSCNQENQVQEINPDDFVEISLEEKGPCEDSTIKATHGNPI
ncbi:uncharacterized protein LOC114518693 [Dendronephthya gigantea]|uniref:uncharacterized protein LOC114518693 n=1 Tax=Dendronephthya gigantea TaxID=151771 RepID=UPI00106BCA15|nr:uncharacterized protein LOC114518693 [Dendronephthya gigantea]